MKRLAQIRHGYSLLLRKPMYRIVNNTRQVSIRRTRRKKIVLPRVEKEISSFAEDGATVDNTLRSSYLWTLGVPQSTNIHWFTLIKSGTALTALCDDTSFQRTTVVIAQCLKPDR